MEKVFENMKGKLLSDSEYKMRQKSLAGRPNPTLEDKETNKVSICDMACPQEDNIEAQVKEKLDQYQQLAFNPILTGQNLSYFYRGGLFAPPLFIFSMPLCIAMKLCTHMHEPFVI